jgi:hypothetical protein
MKSYTIKNWLACADCKESLEADYDATSAEVDAVGVSEILDATERQDAKCCYCDVEIEHDSDTLSKLKQQSEARAETDRINQEYYLNGRDQ